MVKLPAMQKAATVDIKPELSASLGESVPRYTSYPTAPHFHAGVDAITVRGWMDALEGDDEISLYLHIPYCDKLCWFCACHTKMTRHYAPVATFLRSLHSEIETVGNLVSGKGRVRAVHFGGGSPTMLKPQDILALGKALRDRFDLFDDVRLMTMVPTKRLRIMQGHWLRGRNFPCSKSSLGGFLQSWAIRPRRP